MTEQEALEFFIKDDTASGTGSVVKNIQKIRKEIRGLSIDQWRVTKDHIAALSEEDRRLARSSKAQEVAANKRIRAAREALREEARRDREIQRMGRAHAAAMREDEARENRKRREASRTALQRDREIQRMGRLHAAAIQMDSAREVKAQREREKRFQKQLRDLPQDKMAKRILGVSQNLAQSSLGRLNAIFGIAIPTTMFSSIKGFFSGINTLVEQSIAKVKQWGSEMLQQAIETGRLKAGTEAALEMNLPSDERHRAGALSHWGRQAAGKVGLPMATMAEYMERLTGYGFRDEDTRNIIAMAADLRARFGAKSRKDDKFIEAMAAVESRGFTAFGDIGRRGRLHQAGIRADLLIPELSKALGLRGSNEENFRTLETMARKEQISKEVLYEAVFKSQEREYGIAGTSALRQSRTLGGALDRFQNIPEQLLWMKDVDQWKGLKTLADFLGRVSDTFMEMEGPGARFMDKVSESVSIIFGGLDKMGAGDFEHMLDSVGDGMTTIAKRVREILDSLMGFLKGEESLSDLALDSLYSAGAAIGEGMYAVLTGSYNETKRGSVTNNPGTFLWSENEYSVGAGRGKKTTYKESDLVRAIGAGNAQYETTSRYGFVRKTLTAQTVQLASAILENKHGPMLAQMIAKQEGGMPRNLTIGQLHIDLGKSAVDAIAGSGSAEALAKNLSDSLPPALRRSLTSLLEKSR